MDPESDSGEASVSGVDGLGAFPFQPTGRTPPERRDSVAFTDASSMDDQPWGALADAIAAAESSPEASAMRDAVLDSEVAAHSPVSDWDDSPSGSQMLSRQRTDEPSGIADGGIGDGGGDRASHWRHLRNGSRIAPQGRLSVPSSPLLGAAVAANADAEVAEFIPELTRDDAQKARRHAPARAPAPDMRLRGH